MKTEGASKVGQGRAAARVGEKKLAAPVTLFAQIEAEQHEGLRTIAFAERRSLADVVREAVTDYLAKRSRRVPGRPAVEAKR